VTTSAPTSKVSFLTYENTTHRIKMQYPSNWLERAGNRALIIIAYGAE
jgi:hypothetical protein